MPGTYDGKEPYMKPSWIRATATLALTALAAAGCGSSMSGGTGMSHSDMAMAASPSMNGKGADSKAADLRAGLNYLLGEHILLAASATGAALGVPQAQFHA